MANHEYFCSGIVLMRLCRSRFGVIADVQQMKLFFAAVGLALAISTSTLIAGPWDQSPPPYPVTSDFFGMHFTQRSSFPRNPSLKIGAMAKPTLVLWPYIQPSRGQFNWTELDAWLDLAERNNIDTTYPLGYLPGWAVSDTAGCEPAALKGSLRCSTLPVRLEDIDVFVTALATRYKGRIKYYELWNEPMFKP